MGKTIIISSHILPELSEMCTTIGIIDHGQLMLKGTIDEIHRAAAMQSPLLITVDPSAVDMTFQILQENPNVQHLTARANLIEVVFTGNKQDEASLLSELVSKGVPILSFNRQEGSLEALFMQIVTRARGQNPQRPGAPKGGRMPMGNPMPMNGMPINGAPMRNGMPMGNPMPMNGMPMNGMPMNGMPMNGAPMNGMPMNGVPMNGMPMNGAPQYYNNQPGAANQRQYMGGNQ